MEDLHIYIYGEIGWEVRPQDVQEQLNKKDASTYQNIIVHLSSLGGGVFDGWTIGNILKGTGKKIEVIIEGACASIATYIALQGNIIKMAETGRYMIHNPSMWTEGDKEDFEAAAAQLGQIKNDLIKAYKRKTGIGDQELSDMMDAEKWMTPEEAKAAGFIDEVIPALKAVAKFDIPKSKYNKEMADNKTNESTKKLDSIIDKAEKLFKNLLRFNPKNAVTIELADGKKLYVESEDGEFVGKKVFLIDAEGNPTEEVAPEGDHTLVDGRVITVNAEGVITAITEVPAEEDEESMEERMEAALAENAALREQIANLTAQSEQVVNENTELTATLQETISTVKNLVSEVNDLKKVTVGGEFKPTKVFTKPANKFKQNREPVSGLNAWAANVAVENGLKVKN